MRVNYGNRISCASHNIPYKILVKSPKAQIIMKHVPECYILRARAPLCDVGQAALL
jgi:hypothetical protein